MTKRLLEQIEGLVVHSIRFDSIVRAVRFNYGGAGACALVAVVAAAPSNNRIVRRCAV